MDVQYTTRSVDDITVFSVLEPHITHENSPYLKEKLMVAITEMSPRLILDLSSVETLDSSGISALLFGIRQARNNGGNLRLAGVNQGIQNILKIAQLTNAIELFDKVEDALEEFK